MKKYILVLGLLALTILLAGCIEDQKYNENYCGQFSYDDCPLECEVGPSCSMCDDIGCHSKAGLFWAVGVMGELPFILPLFFALVVLTPLGGAYVYSKVTKKSVNYKKIFIMALSFLIALLIFFALVLF